MGCGCKTGNSFVNMKNEKVYSLEKKLLELTIIQKTTTNIDIKDT